VSNVTNALIFGAAVLGFATAFLAFLQSRQNSKRIGEVHVLINSRMTDALSRIQQLTTSLQQQGIDIPDDPSLRQVDNGVS
jgi:hypothetical protein